MKKKLLPLLLLMLIILVGNANAATLTQKLGNSSVVQSVSQGQQVTLKFINKENYTFSRWIVESGGVSIDTTEPTVSFTMPNTNVVIKAKYAEEVVGSIASVVSVGDYVTYVPSSTSYKVPTTVSGYTSDQTFNPSSATSWRVFSNDGTNVEIISTNSVGDLYLKGSTGYINAVQTLNDLSASFVNTAYAISGRSLGYCTDGLSDVDNYKVINIATYLIEYGVTKRFPYYDNQYTADQAVLSNHGSMYHSNGNVWLASRSYGSDSSDSIFSIRQMGNGISNGGGTRIYSDDTVVDYNNANGVRPIVSLKSSLTITGGTGTEADPYIINTTNPSQYTVTYCANGGYGEMMPQSVARGSSITLNANTYEHHQKSFLGWSTSATATSATYTDGQSITPTADMTLYAVWQENRVLLSTKVNVGDYVTYVPSSTSYKVPTTVSGYASEQTFNPSSATSWRVFSNDGTNVEIISTDSVGTLYLSGQTGYANAVQTLNDMSTSFANSAYAISARSLGYYDKTRYIGMASGSAMTGTELANYKVINPTSYSLDSFVQGFPYVDYQYTPDRNVLNSHSSMYHSSGDVWLASRNGYLSVDETLSFQVQTLDTSGSVRIYAVYYSNAIAPKIGKGVRPVVSIKSNTTITGGSGTEADPYIINTTNPSQYTITYCANGGYGEMMPQSVARGSNITLNANTYKHHSKSFVGWSASPTATSATYTDGQSITPTADMTLYAVWKEATYLASTVSVGDYVTYVPSSTSYTVGILESGYTSAQTYNPSTATSWRVFSNDGTITEIISADSVGTLYLTGSRGYEFVDDEFEDFMSAYVNSTYAISARSLDYENNDFEYWVTTHKMIASSDRYILMSPSRYFENTDYEYYRVRKMNAIAASHETLARYDKNNGFWYPYTADFDILPIIKLKPGLRIASGSGTAGDPYIIDETYIPEYTLTYDANGGSGAPAPQEGVVLTISTAPTRSGYTFLGWAYNRDSNCGDYYEGNSIILTANTILYAIWDEEEEEEIEYCPCCSREYEWCSCGGGWCSNGCCCFDCCGTCEECGEIGCDCTCGEEDEVYYCPDCGEEECIC